MQNRVCLLCLIAVAIISVSINSISCASLSKTSAAQRTSTPFFGTKGGRQVSAPQIQEQEAALPNFVEPPAAPVPEPDAGEPQMPYEFEYSAVGTDGSSARREVNDGNRVTGTYTLAGPDGINRVVHYVADKDGFRATIVTNEPGTESQSPSGVILNSSQLPAEQIALQYGPREPAPGPIVRFPAPIPVVPVFAASPQPLEPLVLALPARLTAPSSSSSSEGSASQPSSPSAPARLLAAAGVKGLSAPIVQQRKSPAQARKTAAIKSAPVVQQRQEQTAAIKSAPVVQQRQEAVKSAPVVQQRQEQAIKAPIRSAPPPPAAIKAPLKRPTLAPIKAPARAAAAVKSAPVVQQRQEQGKTAPARVQSKTAPIKAPRQPFYATLPPPPPPPPAVRTTTTTTTTTRAPEQQLELLRDEQQQEQQQQEEEPQQLEQLRNEPQQQQQQQQDQTSDPADDANDQEDEDQEGENGSGGTFF